MVIKVVSKYASEDEAIVGLICRTAARKYLQKIGMFNGEGILIEYMGEEEKMHISDLNKAESDMSVIFDFGCREEYDKKLVIMNHSLEEYNEMIKKEFDQEDVILIKNYIPSYKSEKTLFGPNELKSIYRKGTRVFALELDVKIQNSVFLGIMEDNAYTKNMQSGKTVMKRRLMAVYNSLVQERG
jgi:hypothetical protein